MYKRPDFKFKQGDIVRVKKTGHIRIVVKTDWQDYYVEDRPIRIVETERVHLLSKMGLDIIHASDVELA